MIKSINQWAFAPDRPLPEVFAMARDNGFAAVEVTIGETGDLTPASSADDCARIVEQADKAGVTLSGLASGFGWNFPMTCADESVRRRGIELNAGALRVAKNLGIDAILVVPGGVGADFIPGFQGAPYDVAYKNALDALKELAPLAEELGVTLAVENVWNMFLLSPLEMRDFLDEVGSPRVQSYFDVGNAVAFGYPEQWARILGERIARVHFKDFKRAIATIDGFCDLLEGDTDYPAVMKELRAIGYAGPVAAEFFDVEADLPTISAAMDRIMS